MLLHTQTELETEGRPSRKELLLALVATVLVVAQASSFLYRLVRSIGGEPLSLLFFADVRIGEPGWHYLGGVAIYVAGIAVCLFILWACGLQFQRWLYWKRRR